MDNSFLAMLGNNLRDARKRTFPNDDLAAFSVRIGVSRATLQKMEKGDLSVSLGRYYKVAKVLKMQSQIEGLFFKEPSLFDRYPDSLINRAAPKSGPSKAGIATTRHKKPRVTPNA